MTEYEYRIGAKIVATLDCIIAGINVLLVLVCFCGVVFISYNPDAKDSIRELLDKTTSSEDIGDVVIGGWVLVLIVAIFVVILTTAAIKLWRATDPVAVGACPAVALSQAKFWRVVTIVITVLGGISYLLTFRLLYFIFLLVFRCVCLYVVHKYIEELEIAKNGGDDQGRDRDLQKV